MNYVKLYEDVKIKIMKVINLKKLFTLFGKTAEDTINTLKKKELSIGKKGMLKARRYWLLILMNEVTYDLSGLWNKYIQQKKT